MMSKSSIKRFLIGSLLVLGCSAAQSAELVTNGSFESGGAGWGVGGPGPGVHFLPVAAYNGCCSLTGTYPAPLGSNAAFFGAGNMIGGSIFQDLSTLAGGNYTLNWSYGAISLANLQQMHVTIFDGSTVLNSVNIGAFGTGNLSAMMVPYSLGFVASSGFTRISFSDFSPTTNNTDGVLDAVSVLGPAPVPEPSTYALMLAGLGIVVFAARRRSKRMQVLSA